MSDDEYRFPLNPPLVVSGRVEIVSPGEQPFDFTHGMAVALHGELDSQEDAPYMYYIVVMPNGWVYEVDHRNITSARPWEPGACAPLPTPVNPDAPDSVRDILSE